ncbi:WD40/YVTN repeat-like-containing domain,WD40-repeat-containing domain,Quinoprotein alcohol [Cinara cedri]|uniref:WD40/YVTN repeat-like-containing domain,WD40-repeat-containing domain,Quinoprotein alcohol n=1 Tax=Cinara cedri TaxID=506608 RepID=A0A5E4MWB3_9HEMI|nr:WD40/YVTN repeat-like-containing domain,WD40-repeat-containing domain,Quinoprotein alcohol [Cinara cedri]
MNTFEITQSPNQYKSNAITLDKYGKLMAYGSKSIVVLVKGLESNSVFDFQYNRLKYNTQKAHGRIAAVSFSHETDNYKDAYYLASIDEVNIYVWEVQSLACKHLNSFANETTKIVLLDVAWLYKCLTLVAISDSGTLHKWNIQTLDMHKYTFDLKMQPLTLVACPHKSNIIAIGCKHGNLIIYDLIGDGQILHKLCCHERNIYSLAWCPVPFSPLGCDRLTQPLLLASTASDSTGLNIWRAGLDMGNEAKIVLPDKPLRETVFKNNINIIWSCIRWAKPTLIIITTPFGEILKVKFKPKPNFEAVVSLISDSHKDVIFTIACSFESAKPYLWSSCMSRKLIRTPLFDTAKSGDLPLEIPTLNGFVYCFALSLVNASNVGDGKIYYWNVFNEVQLELFTLNSVSSKVLSLAYHPKNDNLLAFGTDDGRVGIINLRRKQNNVNLLKTVLSHPVYRLCWAPLPNQIVDVDTKFSLYAVGNGQILIYNDSNIWKDPHNLKEYIQFNEIEDSIMTPVKHIDMAWKMDYSVAAIGNSNGTIYLLEGDTLKLKHVVYGHVQSVECIIWHPTYVTCDYSKESKYKNYFASSSHTIRVYQFNDDSKPLLVVEFKGHTEKINELAWSPHRNLWLLSCSSDMTAKVWDVQQSSLIGVYSKHLSAVLCGIFSPLDCDIVFTGSADSSVHSWRISNNLPNEIIDCQRDTNLKQIQQFPFLSHYLHGENHLEEAVHTFINDYFNDKKVHVAKPSKFQINNLAFFGKIEDMKQLLINEKNVLLKTNLSNKITSCAKNISLWRQNLEGHLKNAIETNTINEWMVAVSPTISFEFWKSMCDAYVRQLEEAGEFSKASTYLVGLKKFKEATMMLIKNHCFCEALLITLSQEKPDQEIIIEITTKWAQYNILHENFIEAAHRYLSINDGLNAMYCLMKVKQIRELSLAAKLARYLNEDIEKLLVVDILNTEYFKYNKWNRAKEFLENHPKLVYLNMWVSVHQAMFELDPNVTPKIIKNWICTTDSENKFTILDYILEHIDCKPDYYEKLVCLVESEFISDIAHSLPKSTVYIAGQLCLIALQYQKTRLLTIDSQKRLIKCFTVAYNYEMIYSDLYKLLSRLMIWIFPKGPLALDLCTFELNNTLIKTIRAYLCYNCFLWLKLLYTDLNKQIKEIDTDDRNNVNTIYDEIIILTHQFQQLFNNYIHDILDLKTLNYFNAKNEIERINKLLASDSFADYVGDTINEQWKECNKTPNSIDEVKYIKVFQRRKKLSVVNEIVLESLKNYGSINNTVNNPNHKLYALKNQEESSYFCKSLQEMDINNCDLVYTCDRSTKTQHHTTHLINSPEQNFDYLNSNNFVRIKSEKCKKKMYTFFQNIKSELDKYNCLLNDQPIVQRVTNLEIEASKKKKLEKFMIEFENERINSPDPFLFIAVLKNYINTFEL